MSLLELKNIYKDYFLVGGLVQKVLKGINLQVNKGDFVSIMGPSGSGKSTFMNILGCLDQPTSGDYLLNGENVAKMNVDQLAEIRRNQIGFVFQGFNLLMKRNILDNVSLPLIYCNTSKYERKEKAFQILKSVNLAGYEYHFPNQLSGGMQQRVAVARALAGYPRVLLLDEPLGAIDFQMRELLQNELDSMVQEANITAVMVTHDVSESVFMSDRVIVLGNNHGHIVSDYKINLPRKRDRDSDEFKKCVAELTTLVREAFNEDVTATET